MLSQVQSGAIEFVTLSGLVLSTLVPAASIQRRRLRLPELRHGVEAMDGALGAYVRAQVEKSGLVGMDRIWDNGFRQITSSKPITRLDDLHDFRIRVPVSPLWISLFQAFGAAPANINFAEVYSRCRPGWWTDGKIRSPSPQRPSSTRCRHSTPSPTKFGMGSGC